jgi:hypothetical protein
MIGMRLRGRVLREEERVNKGKRRRRMKGEREEYKGKDMEENVGRRGKGIKGE